MRGNLFIPESQTEINVAEQDLRKAKDTKTDIERKLRVVEEERSSLERVMTRTLHLIKVDQMKI